MKPSVVISGRRIAVSAFILCGIIASQAKDVTLNGFTTAGENANIQVTYALNSTEKIARVKKVIDKNGIDGKKSCVIPSSITVDGVKYSVTKIGVKAFSWSTDYPDGTREGHINHGFEKIVLPSTIVEIGTEAFYCCGYLTSCELPKKIQTIGTKAFEGSRITSVDIPGSCTTIGESAFRCSWLTSVTFADSSTPLSIKNEAFRNSGIKAVTLPARLTAMGNNVFTHCYGLKNVVINANLPALPNETFYDSKLISVQINGPIQTIGDRAFYENNELASVTFPSTLRAIGESAFEGCFWNGTTFNGVLTLPYGLQTIGQKAFYECGFTGINIPSTVTSIGSGAFVGTKLNIVKCDAVNPPTTTTWALFDINTYINANLTIPTDSWKKYESATGWSMFNYDKYSGVEDVPSDGQEGIDFNAPADVYDFRGMRVADSLNGLAPGMYIVRQGTKTIKFSVK